VSFPVLDSWQSHLLSQDHQKRLQSLIAVEVNLQQSPYCMQWPENYTVVVTEIPDWYGIAASIILRHFSNFGLVADLYHDPRMGFAVIMFASE